MFQVNWYSICWGDIAGAWCVCVCVCVCDLMMKIALIKVTNVYSVKIIQFRV